MQHDLIQQLEQQFLVVEQQVTHTFDQNSNWFNHSNWFLGEAFYSQSEDISDYLAELKNNIGKLRQTQNPERLDFISAQITNQFVCFKNLLNSQNVNKKYTKKRSSYNKAAAQQFAQQITRSSRELYQELSKLQEYERRLFEMVQEKQTVLNSYKGDKLRADYQQQVLLTQQRLGRCRKAISQVEEQIQQQDNRTR